jgi:beta-glucanase (GH16 family)
MKSNLLKVTAVPAVAILTLCAGMPRNEIPKRVKETVVFFDDFSGKEINRANWNVAVSGHVTNDELQAYVDSSATLQLSDKVSGAKNGALVINAHYAPGFKTKDGQTFDFISGKLESRGKKEFVTGKMSARMKLPAGSGYWPAFWALGINKDWPACGEIDIMEYVGEPDWVSAALHGPNYSGETPLVNKVFLKKENNVTQWHVYSVDWQKDALLFYVDDVLYYRVTRPMIENYGKWAFDNPHFLIVNFALGGGYPAKTNGDKKPYFGLPQSTLDDIKAGNAKVYVDWVKVTR